MKCKKDYFLNKEFACYIMLKNLYREYHIQRDNIQDIIKDITYFFPEIFEVDKMEICKKLLRKD